MSKVQMMVCECDCHNYQPPDSDVHCPDCEPSGRDRMLEAKAAEFAAEITRLKSEIASLESRHAEEMREAYLQGWRDQGFGDRDKMLAAFLKSKDSQ